MFDTRIIGTPDSYGEFRFCSFIEGNVGGVELRSTEVPIWSMICLAYSRQQMLCSNPHQPADQDLLAFVALQQAVFLDQYPELPVANSFSKMIGKKIGNIYEESS